MLRLYDKLSSGNGYKARLLLHQLGLPFERVEVDTLGGATRTPEYLSINPIGKIPTLRLEDGDHLAESNAILYFLAQGTPYWPGEPRTQAEALKWMFFEQYSHEPAIAVVRSWIQYENMPDGAEDQLARKYQDGYAALQVMEDRLAEQDFLAGDRYSIADISLFAYTHVAGQGGFDLAPYAAIRAWLDRIEGQPGFVPITLG